MSSGISETIKLNTIFRQRLLFVPLTVDTVKITLEILI